MDITAIILDDHRAQRALFAMIEDIGPGNKDALAAIWKRVSNQLETHAEAEERYFYPRLLKIGSGANDADSAAEETRDAIKDHNEIRDAIAAVNKHAVGSAGWFKAVDKANKANCDHMAEEERQGLADFRRNASLKERHDLAIEFVTFKYANLDGIRAKDKDPAKYVRENA